MSSPAGTHPKVVVVGQGYVGLPLAIRAAAVGYRVTGYDIDDGRVKRLMAGDSYIQDVPSSHLQQALRSGHYRASSEPVSCAGFDVAVVTVPTPLRDGIPDLSGIETAAGTLARHLGRGATVILESTTYPGTTEELVGPILEEGSGLRTGEDFHLGYSPERVDPGNEQWQITNIPKVVSGVDVPSLTAVRAFYDRLVERTVAVSGTREAELSKLLENTFRHVNIALVNELAMFAADLGLNLWEAIDAASTKPFGFMPFTPGPGVGGHCLPIDPSYLSWRVTRQLGQPFRFVELANDVNEYMPEYVVRRLAVNGSRFLLLGLTYKRNVSDARESPAMSVADRLLSAGAEVQAADPYVQQQDVDPRIHLVEATDRLAGAADAVVLLVDHDAFELPRLASSAVYFFDTRHRVTGPTVEYL